MILRVRAVLVLAFLLVGIARGQKPPVTPKYPVVDRYSHGLSVTDPYRWLEEIDAKAVRSWVEAQNDHTATYINRLPDVRRFRRRVEQLYEDSSTFFSDVQYENGVLCAKRDGVLVVLKSVDDPKPVRTLLDPDKSFPGHEANIDFYYLSQNGRYAGVCISLDNKEDGSAHVYDTRTGKKLDDVVPRVSGPPGGDLTWNRASTGFYYTRYPFADPGGKPHRRRYANQEVWFHRIGDDPKKDIYVCGDEFRRFPQTSVVPSDYGKDLFVAVSHGGDFSGQTFYLMRNGGFEKFARPEDQIVWVMFDSPSSVLLQSNKGAPRGRIMSLALDTPTLDKAKVLIPEQERQLSMWAAAESVVYATYFKDGIEKLKVFDKKTGKLKSTIDLPPFATVGEMALLEGDRLVYMVDSYLQPTTWYVYEPGKEEKPKRLPMSEKWGFDMKDVEVLRETATSGDGTKIPITILKPKGIELDGKRPVYLQGYGGFGVRDTPIFLVRHKVWLEQAGIWAIAHPRGEGEYGEAWHRPVAKANHHITIDDFLACAEHLIAKKYTNPKRLAITGGSHGGLLVGMALTRRPDLFCAAIGDVGVYDVLRQDEMPFGAHTAFEYGALNDINQFRRMRANSPYHQVKTRTEYPAVWLRTGANDRRVMPWNSWKMVAKLQASGSKKPVLLNTSMTEGHNLFWSMAEDFAFLFEQMGLTYQTPKNKPAKGADEKKPGE